MEWEIVIGLETHAQLSTVSKMFSGGSTAFGAAPNVHANAVDIALPGVLPVANKGAVERAIRFGLAVGAKINRRSVFARKNYFYPDLPKGYQISQYELPIVQGGEIPIISPTRGEIKIRLTRAHLEEDAGKSFHGEAISAVPGYALPGLAIPGNPLVNEDRDLTKLSAIDLNRAGTPLLEIVSEPEMHSAEEAVAYAKTLHSLVRWIGICDGNMQEGSFRCDANVSVRRPGGPLGTRAEIKNLNSFRFLERAIEFEVKRQIEILEDGGKIMQETRLYDPDKDETRSMRSKEDAQDYRYFPDPDLPPLEVSEEWIEGVRVELPELPQQMAARFVSEYRFAPEHAALITFDRETAVDFDEFWKQLRIALGSKTEFDEAAIKGANWAMVEFRGMLKAYGIDKVSQSPIGPKQRAGLVARIIDGTISHKIGKEVLEAMWIGGGTADEIIEKRGLKQISDSGAIEKIIEKVLAANAKQVEDYRAGKEKAFNSLVGQVMKATQGKANPAQVNEILKRRLAG
ncbi:MAG TPA: Asp-tRNA(Asn)/Glu-tRNA(Gln) amidotransferase subunit GatB [Burkholderiales bacterium]|nr:Asp-tRNA(Asn)/Glu-tRNA(Gln) amidotransferase subunit GatB [Burkholderiales bacterium]